MKVEVRSQNKKAKIVKSENRPLSDRTASPPGEGLKSYTDTGNATVYDKTDTRPVISPVAQAMLIKFGSLVSSKSGAVRLVRA